MNVSQLLGSISEVISYLLTHGAHYLHLLTQKVLSPIPLDSFHNIHQPQCHAQCSERQKHINKERQCTEQPIKHIPRPYYVVEVLTCLSS